MFNKIAGELIYFFCYDNITAFDKTATKQKKRYKAHSFANHEYANFR